MPTANIDADLITYRVGFTTQDITSPDIVASRVDTMVQTITEGCQTEDLAFFLSDSQNFRFKVYPEYKANRPPKPKWQPWIRDYLIDEYAARIIPYHEADDALAMFQTEDTICVSIDKDLLQIAGQHYNFVTGEWQHVEEFDGLVWFYRQILMGDNTDNLPGLFRIGKSRSWKLLKDCTTEQELWDVVSDTYQKHEVGIEYAVRNAQCMWCHRTPVDPETLNNIWKVPNGRTN